MRKLLVASSILATAFVASQASAVELVSNGGFEGTDSGGFYGAGWDIAANFSYSDRSYFFDDWSSIGFGDAPVGVSAFLGFSDDDDVTISQSISTAGFSAGTLTLDLYSDGYDDAGGYDNFDVSFGGVQLDVIDLGNNGDPFNKSLSYDLTPWFDGSNHTLDLHILNDSSFATWSWVDNVSIKATPVPEPTSWVALGLGAVALIRRRARA